MSEVVEHPPQPRRDRRRVVVRHHQVLIPDPERRQPVAEHDRIGEGMASRTGRGDEVAVDVDVGGARQVAGIVGRRPGPGLAEVPAAIDEPEPAIVEHPGEGLDRDERAYVERRRAHDARLAQRSGVRPIGLARRPRRRRSLAAGYARSRPVM